MLIIESGCIVIVKQKEYIEDMDRTVIATKFKLVNRDELEYVNKNDVKAYLSDRLLEYFEKHKHWTPYSSIQKKLKSSYKINYQPDKYDKFQLTIKQKSLKGKSLEEYFDELAPANEKDVIKTKSKTWRVEGSKGDTYWVKKSEKGWECSCPHWKFRARKQGIDCKHILSKK